MNPRDPALVSPGQRRSPAAAGTASGEAAHPPSIVRYLSQRLEESRQAASVLERLLARLAAAVIVTDGEGRVRFWSEGAQASFGIASADAAGRPLQALLGDGIGRVDGIRTIAGDGGSGAGGRENPPVRVEVKGRSYELIREPLDGDGGGAAAYALVSSDRLRELEREVELLRPLGATGRLLATVLHEIRNPLTAIQGTAALIESRCPRELRPQVARILDAAALILRMAEDLLILSRPVRPRIRPLPAAPLLADALRTVKGISPPGIRKEVRVSAGLPHLLADPDLVTQILGNLIRNAVEAMGAEGVLTLQALPAADRRVRILVRDTGPGLDPRSASRIFEPFHSEKPGGTGLGLPTARRLAEAMGGRLDVVAAPERGAVFVLELPAASPEG